MEDDTERSERSLSVSRRRYLAAQAALGAGLLAGCSLQDETSTDTPVAGDNVVALDPNDRGDPLPSMDTMAGVAYVADMYNAFIRQSDNLRRACHTHLPVRMIPPDTNPLQPVGYTLKLYASVFVGDRTWEVIEAPTDGETRDIPETGDRIRAMEDVPYVDATAMATPENDALCLFPTNRNLRESSEVTVDVPEAFDGTTATLTVQRPTGDPHDAMTSIGDYPESWYEWTGLDVYEIDEREVAIADGTLTLSLESAAIIRVMVE